MIDARVKAIYHVMLSKNWLVHDPSDGRFVVWVMDDDAATVICKKVNDSHDRVDIANSILQELKEEKSNEAG